jgi:hypothetical protein
MYYNFVFKGDEKHIQPQLDYINELIHTTYGKCMTWKHKSNEHRTLQYCGVPVEKSWHNKYTMASMTEDDFSKVAEHLGKPSRVVTNRMAKTHTLGYIPMFSYMGLDNPTAFKEKFTELFFDLDEYFARAKKLRGGNVKVENSHSGEGPTWPRSGSGLMHPNTRKHYDEVRWQQFTTVPTAKVKLQPWAVLDTPALEEATRQLHNEITGIDTAGLTAAETRLCDEWNATLKIWRKKRAPEDKNSPEYKAWKEQDYINDELKDVRSQLGIVKRKLTRAMKSGNGIDFDLSEFSIV